MRGPPDRLVALERARWLDELTDAISQAQRLAWSIGVAECDCPKARQLYARLEAVRSEIDFLRLSDWVAVRKEIDPKWLKRLLDGSHPVPDACDE